MSRVQLTVLVGLAAFAVSLGVWWLVGGLDALALTGSTVTALVATAVAHRTAPPGGLSGGNDARGHGQ